MTSTGTLSKILNTALNEDKGEEETADLFAEDDPDFLLQNGHTSNGNKDADGDHIMEENDKFTGGKITLEDVISDDEFLTELKEKN